jgi:uncharacterized protein YbaR (Trm112 family)
MKRDLLNYLCDPVDGSALVLVNEVLNSNGEIESGSLVAATGRTYPIVRAIPRFVPVEVRQSVDSFGDEWNYFNYDDFRVNWLEHVVSNTFGGIGVFHNKVIVDAGAGSGMQTKWMAELGARRVIALELSHSVDGVMKSNLSGLDNVDIIQCSIDAPPIRSGSIPGLVICHNVIQHTASVNKTAESLYSLVGKGEFVFNCYLKYSDDAMWMVRWHLVYRPLRAVLARCPFWFILGYAKTMAALRFLPIIGALLETAQFVIRGDVPRGPNLVRRLYRSAVLNTFDWYGSHTYQHQLTPDDLRLLVHGLQPDDSLIVNLDAYCSRPLPPGLAIRVSRG